MHVCVCLYARIASVHAQDWCTILLRSASALSLGRFQAASLLSAAMLVRAGGHRVGETWDFLGRCLWLVRGERGGSSLIFPSLTPATMPLVVRDEWVRVQGKGPPKATDFGCHSERRCRHGNNCLQLEQATPRVCVCPFLIVVFLLLLFLSIITCLVFSKRMLTLPSFVWCHLTMLLWNRRRLHHKIASEMVV